MNESQKDLNRMIDDSVVDNIMKNKNSDISVKKDVHNRNYFKIGLYVGAFLTILYGVLGIGNVKQTKVQDIFPSISQYTQDIIFPYPDLDSLEKEFRISLGAEDIATFGTYKDKKDQDIFPSISQYIQNIIFPDLDSLEKEFKASLGVEDIATFDAGK